MLLETLRDVPDEDLPDRLGVLADELQMDLVVWDAEGRVLAEATPGDDPAAPPGPGLVPGSRRHRAHRAPARRAPGGAAQPPPAAPAPGRSLPAGVVILSLVMAAGSFPVARHLAKRIERVAVGVERWGQGDFAHRVPVEGRDEVATLAATFNQAADESTRS